MLNFGIVRLKPSIGNRQIDMVWVIYFRLLHPLNDLPRGITKRPDLIKKKS